MNLRVPALALLLFLLHDYCQGQINTSQVKTSVRKTVVNSDNAYLPKGSVWDSTGSYALHYSDRRVCNLNTTSKEWNTSWVPAFWDKRWGTKAKSIDEANEETIQCFNFMATDHRMDALKNQVEQAIIAESPGAKKLFETTDYGFNEIGNWLREGRCDVFYDLNNDNVSDITLHIVADYRDTLLDGYSTAKNQNCDVDIPNRTFKPFMFTAEYATSVTGKVALYSIDIKFYQDLPLTLSFLPKQTSMGCFGPSKAMFLPVFGFNGRFAKGTWELGCDHMDFVPTVHFDPIQENFHYVMNDDLFDTCSFYMRCTVNGKAYRSTFSLIPYYNAGYTGCPAFTLDSAYVTTAAGVKTLSLLGTINNIEANGEITGTVNDKACVVNARIGKKIKRSKTVKVDILLNEEPANLKLIFFVNGDPLPEYIVTAQYQQEIIDRNKPKAVQQDEKATIKWLNPSSGIVNSTTDQFALTARVFSGQPVKDVSVVPVEGTKITVEYQTYDSIRTSMVAGKDYTDVYMYVVLKQPVNKYKLIVTLKNGEIVESTPATIKYQPQMSITGPDTTRNLFIVSVGINQYRDNGFADLKYARKDAEQIDSAFRAQRLLPDNRQIWDSIYSVLLVDSQATTNGILNAVRNLPADPNDVIIFFFSGHGKSTGSVEGGNRIFYMITHDCIKSSTDLTALSYEKLKLELGEKGCNSIILLDACFSGAALDSKASDEDIQLAVDENRLSTGFTDKVRLTVSSCTSFQVSADDTTLQNGILARAILLALGGQSVRRKSDNSGISPDVIRDNGILDSDELWIFCRDAVYELSGHKQRSGNAKSNSYDAINLFVLPN